MQERLGAESKEFAIIREKAGANLRQLIIEAATGTVPVGKESERKHYQSHSQDWFKSLSGGQELANKVFAMNLWPNLKEQFLLFANAVRKAVALPQITDIAL